MGPFTKRAASFSENDTGVVIYDKENPRSVYNLVSAEMRRAMERIDPDFYTYNFNTLEKHLKPDARDYQLRVSFWREYAHVQDEWKDKISINSVIRGVCTNAHFFNHVLREPLRLAFTLYPVTDMQASMEEMMDLGLREMRKILKMNVEGPKGANLPVIREKIKIVALLQNRIQGSVVQRVAVDQRVQLSQKEQQGARSLKDIQKEITRLERNLGKLTLGQAPKSSAETGDETKVLEAEVVTKDG